MIKYHEYGHGNDYGTDYRLTNNWNPEDDYNNEYVNVYFRIDTPTYDFNGGFKTTEERENFFNEADNLFNSFGIINDLHGKLDDERKKTTAYLYPHPQEISGCIRKNDVKAVAEAINKMATCKIRWVDLYETVYVISDEEYAEYLSTKQEEIKENLFKLSATPRTNKYVHSFELARNIAGKIRLNRLGLNDGKNYGGGQTIDFILEVMDKMITDGLLKECTINNCKYVRSLNKTEQRNKFKKLLYV